ncbi:flagellar protein FlgN [Herbaspirillum sp. meg3]|uniref:flagella synthesis protein FlgN n=1 Tax=Herbaspirillum sp. meg3 TaxID=2025949 RepID=UPI000B98A596|nr:flagellar protein FlgN [Herbaspirillum sp. meg3]ASU38270.1 flagellar protein FlgN [Herbaspirillum sp. meg3]
MTSTTSQRPSHYLAEEKQVTSRLVATLQQEQTLLSGNGDADEIPKVINEKALIIAEMARLADQRYRLLSAAGFHASENGMQSWLDQHGAAADKGLWNELFELAQTARELNRVNGTLVGRQMAINQNALKILQGRSGGGSLYGPDGSASVSTTGRPLGIG